MCCEGRSLRAETQGITRLGSGQQRWLPSAASPMVSMSPRISHYSTVNNLSSASKPASLSDLMADRLASPQKLDFREIRSLSLFGLKKAPPSARQDPPPALIMSSPLHLSFSALVPWVLLFCFSLVVGFPLSQLLFGFWETDICFSFFFLTCYAQQPFRSVYL
uniref:Uncharacterized protein n=1 Tax=Pipistrellus kuhlii TaxID=59472 RepID=A0A7J8B1L1_PIPKU|nr:hypothetical protein mPipKuh1_007755 [Pipistrellus kuhlii]